MKRDVPDFVIEQLYLNEIDGRLREDLLSDPLVSRRLEELRRSNAEILAAYPTEEILPRIRGRIEAVERAEAAAGPERPPRRRERPSLIRRAVRWRGFVPVLAAAAALALVVGFLPGMLHGPGEDGVRIKGSGPVIHVYRETSGGAERLTNGTVARAHDLLQLSYIAAGAQFGMIFSVDGAGTVTLHYPEGSSLAAHLTNGGEVALPYSYELDNAPQFERFYLVTASREFPVNEILSLARQSVSRGSASTIAFPAGFAVSSVTVKKER